MRYRIYTVTYFVNAIEGLLYLEYNTLTAHIKLSLFFGVMLFLLGDTVVGYSIGIF